VNEVNVGAVSSNTKMELNSINEGTGTNKAASKFSSFLGKVEQGKKNEKEEQNSETAESLLGIVNLQQVKELKNIPGLSEEQLQLLENLSGLNLADILKVLNIDGESFTEALTQLQGELSSNLTVTDTDKGNIEDMMFQVLQLLQNISTKDMLKTNLKSVEETVKLAKIIELLGSQKDLGLVDARKAAELQEQLKGLGSKMEGIFKELTSMNSKWSELLKQAYGRQLTSADSSESPASEKTQQKGPVALQGNQFQFTIAKTEQFSLSLIGANRTVNYEQFVNEFTKILGKSQLFSQPNTMKMLIKLYPENLGSLRIELLQQNGVMTAKILATTASAKELLDSQLHGLKQAFSSQNLPVEKIEIAQALSESNRQERGQNQQQATRDNRNDQQSSTNQQQSEEEEESFKELLMNIEI
jgi:flagellar hook-length control protein FliK